jgi:hypothetical protein
LYKKLLHKCVFCQAHCVEWFKSIHTKFSLPFLDTPTTFYEFWKFEIISGIYLNKKEKKRLKQCMGRIRPAATVQGSAACHARSADQLAGPWPGDPVQPRPSGGASPRTPADKVSRKRWCEHREGGGNTPDKVAAARAHPSSGSTCGGGVVAARRCPTVAEALRSQTAPVAGSCSTGGGGEGEAHATYEPRCTEDHDTYRLSGGAMRQ